MKLYEAHSIKDSRFIILEKGRRGYPHQWLWQRVKKNIVGFYKHSGSPMWDNSGMFKPVKP